MSSTNSIKPVSALTRTNDINDRLYARNIPSEPLQPYLEARAVPTKYVKMPVIDYRRPVSVPLNQDPTFNTSQAFNPGTGFGPWSGFATRVNTETVLRNQIYANQKCSAATYVPSSKSDLYKIHWTNANKGTPTQHSLLFEESQFAPHNANPASDKIGVSLFNNSTRHQLNE